MTLHSWIVFVPLPLMLVALSLDGLSYAEAKPAWRGWGRWVAGAAVAFVGLAAFTGMGARPTVTSSVAGAAVQWDRHVA